MTLEHPRPRRVLAVVLAHSVVVQAVVYVVRPATTYRAIELGISPGWLGALSASFAVAPLVLALPTGAILDRVGERRTAVVGSILVAAAAAVLAAMGDTVLALALGSALLGLGQFCLVVAQQTLVANCSPRAQYDRAFGWYTFAASLGQSIGPAALLFFPGAEAVPDTRAVFVTSAAGGVLLLFLSLAFGEPRAAVKIRHRAEAWGHLLQLPGLRRAMLTSCTVLAAVDITLVYLPAPGAERGIPAATIGLLLTLRGIASMTTRLFLGRLAQAIGRRRLLVGSTLVAAVSLSAAAFPLPLPLLAVLVVLVGLGLGAGQPISLIWRVAAASSDPPKSPRWPALS